MQRHERYSGFTLLEIMVVVVLIAMMATVAIPKLTGTQKRQYRQTVDEIADLMTMYAQRDSLSSSPVGIFHDTQANILTLVSLELVNPDESTDAEWRVDPHVRPVELPPFMDPETIQVYEDGQPIAINQMPAMNAPGRTRPTMVMIVTDGGDERAELTLSPYAITPRVTGLYETQIPADLRQPEDLDSSGRSREDW